MTCPMNYVDPPDVPEGMTLRAYRVDAATQRGGGRARRSLLRRWLRLRAPRVEAPPRPAGA